jgi:hypothetical protein
LVFNLNPKDVKAQENRSKDGYEIETHLSLIHGQQKKNEFYVLVECNVPCQGLYTFSGATATSCLVYRLAYRKIINEGNLLKLGDK